MENLFTSAFKAVGSIFVPGMFGVFLMSVLVTIVVLTGFVIGASAFFHWLPALLHYDWLNGLTWLGDIGAGLLAWFLFPGIMPFIISFFDNRIAFLIERHEYPATPPAQEPPFWPELWHDIRFSLLAISLNILMLPIFFLMHVLAPIAFCVLNGYLLGREFFVMVARRHIPLPQANELRRRNSRSITLAGIGLAVLATVPFANLFAPFWGIAVMVHLYHRLTGSATSSVLPPA